MNYKLSCICLDDEVPALKLLEAYCLENPNLELKGVFSNPIDAQVFLTARAVDLAILDIQMPGLSGVDLFKKINTSTLGIFISANPEFAQQAFEIDIVDFILKPATRERFDRAIQKALAYAQINSQNNTAFLTVKQGYLSHKLPLSEINYVEGAGEYIKIVTATRSYMLFKRLKDFEVEQQKNGFIRIHKSYIVPKTNLASASFGSVKLKSGQLLPLGRLYKSAIGK